MLNNLHDIDLRLIRVFLAVVGAGGVTSAQSTLNVSQSTISLQLSTLETRLGFRLCERGRSGFRLTDKGENFVISARRLLLAIDDFCVEARCMGKRLVGSVNIGLIGNTPINQNICVSRAIARFRQRDEAVKFSVLVRPPSELEELVLNGQLHLAVSYFWHFLPSLEYIPLFEEQQVAYCGQGHPLFERTGMLESTEVADYNWTWRGYPLPEAQHTSPQRQITAVADNMEAVAVLLLSGAHLGYLPAHFAEPYVEQGLLRALNPQQLCYSVPFHVVTRREQQRGEILSAFLEDLSSEYVGA